MAARNGTPACFSSEIPGPSVRSLARSSPPPSLVAICPDPTHPPRSPFIASCASTIHHCVQGGRRPLSAFLCLCVEAERRNPLSFLMCKTRRKTPCFLLYKKRKELLTPPSVCLGGCGKASLSSTLEFVKSNSRLRKRRQKAPPFSSTSEHMKGETKWPLCFLPPVYVV